MLDNNGTKEEEGTKVCKKEVLYIVELHIIIWTILLWGNMFIEMPKAETEKITLKNLVRKQEN